MSELTGNLAFADPALARWVGALVFALLALAVFDRRSRRAFGAAYVVRAVAMALVVLALAGLSVVARVPPQASCVAVAVDRSDSVGRAAVERGVELVEALGRRPDAPSAIAGVAFGREAIVFGGGSAAGFRAALEGAAVDASATSIAAGLEAALATCAGADAEVVLVTDGNETVGEAESLAVLAGELGVPIHVQVVEPAGVGSLVLERVSAPPLVRKGGVFPVRVVVRSRADVPQQATIELSVEGELVAGRTVAFRPGLDFVEVPLRFDDVGTRRVQIAVRLESEALPIARTLDVAVAGPLRVLVASDAERPLAAMALERKRVEVIVVRPESIPGPADLAELDAVVLDNLPHRRFGPGVLEALEKYVRDEGGGLVVTGGARSFGDRRFRGSTLERTLPIRFVPDRPPERGRLPLGLYLLVDRSNSMGYSSIDKQLRNGEKMRYGKRAARALVEQLRDDDRVGVIAFDSDPYVLGELRPLAEQREKLLTRLDRLLPGGGTDFKEALEIAGAQLATADVSVRHLILLTDGDTNRGPADHDQVVATLARLQISVTTIRIGTDDVNLELLKQISERTGGRFYRVHDLAKLPQLLVRDTEEAERREREKRQSGRGPRGWYTEIVRPGPIVRGIAARSLPQVRRPIESSVKREAETVLGIRRDGELRPVLASWQYGLGRAAVFLLDPGSDASSAWAGWTGYSKVWSQLVRWVGRGTENGSRTVVKDEHGERLLEVTSFAADAADAMTVRLVPDGGAGGEEVSLGLRRVDARTFRSALPDLPAGRYAVTIDRHLGGRVIDRAREVIVLESESPARAAPTAESSHSSADRRLLRALAAASAGTIDASLESLFAPVGAARVELRRLDWLLLPLAMSLLLIDVSLRLRRLW